MSGDWRPIVQTTEGRSIDGTTYATELEAEAALQSALGWAEMWPSEPFAVTFAAHYSDEECRHGSAVAYYATQEECDADADGAYAPRIVVSGW